MRRLLLAVLALLFPAFASAETAQLFFLKNIGGSTKTYCVMNGVQGNAWGTPIKGQGTLTTTGSSTTIESSFVRDFVDVAAGDMIIVTISGVQTARSVASVTDGDTLVVDTAVDWSAGYSWSWRDAVCGTADTSGWITATPGMTLVYEYVSGSGTSEVFWQCKTDAVSALPVQIYPDNSSAAAVRSYTASGYDSRTAVVLSLDSKFYACRIGISGTGPVVSAYAQR